MATGMGLSTRRLPASRDREDGVGEKETSEAILSFFNILFASVTLKIVYCKAAILDS